METNKKVADAKYKKDLEELQNQSKTLTEEDSFLNKKISDLQKSLSEAKNKNSQ